MADPQHDKDLFRDDQGVFMISVAAELAGMHPQTLRIYESRGLIEPKRSAGNTRTPLLIDSCAVALNAAAPAARPGH